MLAGVGCGVVLVAASSADECCVSEGAVGHAVGERRRGRGQAGSRAGSAWDSSSSSSSLRLQLIDEG